MVYSPAPLALDRSKPSPWNTERNLTVSSGLWRDLRVAIPFWDIGTGLHDDRWAGPSLVNSVPVVGASGPVGAGVQFDESDDYLAYGNSSSSWAVTAGADFAVAIAFTTRTVTGTAFQYIVSNGGFNDAGGLHMWIGEDSAGVPDQFGARIDDNYPNNGGPQPGVDPNTFYTFVFQRRGGTFLEYIVDGVSLEATSGFTTESVDGAKTMEVGRRADGDVDRYFGGIVHAIYKWDRALLPHEYQLLHVDPFALVRPNWDYVTAAASGTTVSPGVLGLSATLPAASPIAPATTSPATTSPTLSIPSASPAGAANTTPSTISSSVVVPQSSPSGGGNTSPAATELAANLHAVTIDTGGAAATVTPSELAAQLSIAQASPVGAANVTPAALSAALAIPAVDAEGLTLVSPATLESAVSLGQVSLVGGATVTVDALELTVVFGVPVTGEALDHPTGRTSVVLDASTTDAGVIASVTSVSLDKSRTHVTLDETRTDT